MIPVRLSRVRGGEALRTPTIEGQCDALPAVGKPFQLVAEGLEFGTRLVTTSFVVAVDGEQFTTQTGSVYRVEVLHE